MSTPFFSAHEVSRVFSVPQKGMARFSKSKTVPVIRAVNDVSLEVGRGEVFAIVGESGSGKSTLANMMARVATPSAGRIELEGQDIASAEGESLRRLRRRIQMVFQDPSGSLNPRQTVEQIVSLPLRLHTKASRTALRTQVAALLESVHLPADAATRYPGSLSGGQKQRVSIARALALQPELLILDEPTSALDVSVQARILGLLVDLKRAHGLTYIVITHDLAVVRAIADRIAVMYFGQIVEMGSVDQIMDSPRHPYTKALLSAVPAVREEDRALLPAVVVLDGETPSPLRPPSHCAFYSRCPQRQQQCADLPAPSLTSNGAAHSVRCYVEALEVA